MTGHVRFGLGVAGKGAAPREPRQRPTSTQDGPADGDVGFLWRRGGGRSASTAHRGRCRSSRRAAAALPRMRAG